MKVLFINTVYKRGSTGRIVADLGQMLEENGHEYKVAYNRVSEVYSMGDACIVSCKLGAGGFAMPSKTWSIMGCGRAVLASFDEGTQLQRIVEENDCGMFSPAEDSKLLAHNIRYLCENRDIAARIGINARDFIDNNLTRKIGTDKIIDVIEKTYQYSSI